jgi:hypothetical protein
MGFFDRFFGKKAKSRRLVLDEPTRSSKGLVGEAISSMSESDVQALQRLVRILNKRLFQLEAYFSTSSSRAKHKSYEEWLIQGSFQLLMLHICVIWNELKKSDIDGEFMCGLISIIQEASLKHSEVLCIDEATSDFDSVMNHSQIIWASVMNNYLSSDEDKVMQGVAQITNLILFAPMLDDEELIATIRPMAYYTNRGSIDYDLRNNVLDFGHFYKCVDLPGLITEVREMSIGKI